MLQCQAEPRRRSYCRRAASFTWRPGRL